MNGRLLGQVLDKMLVSPTTQNARVQLLLPNGKFYDIKTLELMENKIIENLEQLKKMLVLLSEERKVVLSHHKTFEHVEKMRAIVNESIEMANKQ